MWHFAPIELLESLGSPARIRAFYAGSAARAERLDGVQRPALTEDQYQAMCAEVERKFMDTGSEDLIRCGCCFVAKDRHEFSPGDFTMAGRKMCRECREGAD